MNAKVLIIETDTAFLQNLALRLRQSGIDVFEAENQSHAEQVLDTTTLDVVILDLSGLKQAGLKLLRHIKEDWPEVEVIIINTPEQIGLSIEAMQIGAFNDLSIPFDLASLLELIESAYRKRVRS